MSFSCLNSDLAPNLGALLISSPERGTFKIYYMFILRKMLRGLVATTGWWLDILLHLLSSFGFNIICEVF